MTILVVDDNAMVRRLLKRATTQVADQTFECHDGADALQAYALHLPDVVLMDVVMPRLDGLQATRLLLSKYPTATVIIVTDYCDEDIRRAAKEAGARAFASKDELEKLEELLLTVIEGDDS